MGPGGLASAALEIDVRRDGANRAGYQAFLPGEYTGRYVWIRVTLSTADVTYTARLTRLDVTLDVPDRVLEFPDEVIPVEGKALAFSPPFVRTPSISYALQDGAPGDTAAFIGKESSGVSIRIFDGSGAPKAGLADVTARGY